MYKVIIKSALVLVLFPAQAHDIDHHEHDDHSEPNYADNYYAPNPFSGDNNVSFYISVGGAELKAAPAAEAGIDDLSSRVRFSFEINNDNLVYGAGLSFMFYDDFNPFSENVEDEFGHIDREYSSASGSAIYGELGLRHRLNSNLDVSVVGGAEYMFSSERDISDCIDCYSEAIPIDSGLYISPRLSYRVGQLYMNVAYSEYLSGDIEDTFSVSFGFSF